MADAGDRREGRWLAAATTWWKGLSRVWKFVIGALGAVMLFISVRNQFFPPSPEVRKMPGDVNIAVAEFGSVGPDGEVTVSEESSRLSRSVYEVLERETQTLESDRDVIVDTEFAVQAPDVTGPVDGKTAEERAAQAEAIAERYGAGIVVYAVLDEATPDTAVTPEFFLTDPHLVLDANELVGEYQLGDEVRRGGRIGESISARRQIRAELINRSTGLLQLIVGLSYFGGRDYETARTVFDRLESESVLTPNTGAEILYLFQGNASARLRDFDRAEASYRAALKVRPEYARAMIGLAEVAYQRTDHRCQSGMDASALRTAREMYLAAARSPDRPSGANVETKVAFGTGRIDLCLSMSGNADAWADARAAFDEVIAAFEAGEPGTTDLAAEAWSSRGLLEMTLAEGDKDALQRAIDDLARAIDVGTDPGRVYVWYGLIGFAQCQRGDAEAALGAYDLAIAGSPDEAARQEYVAARERAGSPSPGGC